MSGLLLAALLAASMSSMDSGLNSIGTLLITDFHRRLGIGRKTLARRLGKPVEALNEADELRIGRPLVLVTGLLATIASLAIAQIDDIFTIMIAVVNTFGGPLLAVFLLGIFTRRATAVGALWALAGGTLFTLWLMVANNYPACSWLWFSEVRLNDIWPLTCGVVFSLVLGYAVSLLTGHRKSREELQGLVVGCGKLGVREPAEASLAIPDSFDDADGLER
jgi:Na+/proline symporter